MVQLNRKNCNSLLQEFALDRLEVAVESSLIDSRSDLINQYKSEKQKKKNTITLEYSNTHKVDRVWNGQKKDFYPKYLDNGKWENGLGVRSVWYPYQHKNLSLAKGKWIVFHEGEKACDFATNKGLINTSVVGSGASCETIVGKAIGLCSILGIQGIIYLADNDAQGLKKAKFVQQQAKKVDYPCLVLPIAAIYPEAEKGDDFVEYLQANPEHEATDLKNDLEIAIDNLKDSLIADYENCDQEPAKPSAQTEELPWLEQARKDLFKGSWISVNGVLHEYNGQFYEERETGLIKRKINQWCCNYIDDKGKKSKATPEAVDKVFKWVCQQFWVSPTQVNAEGLPLANGILKVSIDQSARVQINLDDYSADKHFTYQSEIAYNPNADQSHALDLLQCLDEPYKNLFIQSLATILNPQAIKNRWDRIKALMLIGEGSNGKDTLREVISLILGKKGITGCSLNDFRQADTGRGFNLIRLASNPRINWSSENRKINIDGIQALKQAITGDPIYLEAKGKDGFEVELNTLFIFNGNDDPSVKGNQKAIQSRLAVIPFEKVYSTNPIRGELKANPRYKHDKQFLINDVCPAMLNLLLNSFSYIYQNGIDYETSNDYFEQLALENNHLKQFSRDIGLEFTGNKDDTLFVGDVYESLLEWYHINGFLEFETKGTKVKNIWLDNGDKDDPLVKRSRDLKGRLKDIFPKAKERKIRNKIAISGVRLTKIAETLTQQQKLDSHQPNVSLTLDSDKTNVSLTSDSSESSHNNGSKVCESKYLDSHQNNSRLTDKSDNDQANVSLKSGYCESNVSLNVSLNNHQNTNTYNTFANSCESKLKNKIIRINNFDIQLDNQYIYQRDNGEKITAKVIKILDNGQINLKNLENNESIAITPYCYNKIISEVS